MRTALAAGLLLVAGAILVAAGAAFAQAGPEVEAAAPIMKQLDAFRHGDYDAAYGYASADVKQVFDRPAFERMVKNGYPEIARSTFAVVAESEVVADGRVLVRVRVRGANGNSIRALYDMVREPGGWKINGVMTAPDPDLVSSSSPGPGEGGARG